MRNVKTQIAIQLFNAIHEANLSDVNDTDEAANDMPSHCSSGDRMFGNLKEAIIDLGYETQLMDYFDTGDRPSFCFYADGSEVYKYG